MKVLIVGYGSVGSYLLDFILKDHRITNIDEIHIMSRRSEDNVKPRIDLSVVAAGISNRYIPIKYHQCDFNNIDQMSTIIAREDPNIIVYTGRYASGLKYGPFSYPNKIGYGVWMPMSFPYIYKLMKAISYTNVTPTIINTSFPDGVNYLLGKVNLAPTCGAGNINHLIPRIKRAVTELFPECGDISKVNVNLACSHFTNTYVSKEGVDPYNDSLLGISYENKVLVKDKDPDHPDSYKKEIFKLSKDKSTRGHIRNQMIATDCSEIVRIISNQSNESMHLPGVNGLPGGRLCYYSSNTGKFTPSPLWNIDDVDRVNINGLMHDGVIIEDHGISFTQYSIDKMEEVFNIDYPAYLDIDDMQEFADEISSRLKRLVEIY